MTAAEWADKVGRKATCSNPQAEACDPERLSLAVGT